ACAALRCLAALRELFLRHLQVPVAVLVPYEAVNGPGDVVESVFTEALLDLRLDTLQRAHDPAIPRGELDRLRLIQPAVLAFGVHQHEAGGIPQLVAEIAITVAAVQVEVERDGKGGERGE